DGCGTEGCLEGLVGEVLLGLLGDLGEHGVVLGGGGGGEKGAPQLLLGELGRTGQGAQVELLIFRVLRKGTLQVIDRHVYFSDSWTTSILSMFLVGSLACQLQAQTSSDCRASR